MMKLFCEKGQHEWERPPQRGRPPLNCPEHSKPKTQRVSTPSDVPRNSPERMAELRGIKQQRERERAALALEAEQQRRSELEASIPGLVEAYNEAFDRAMSSNDQAAWRKSEVLQHRIIQTRKALA